MPSLVVGARAGEHFRPELEAKLAVLHPAALGGEPFPGADGRQGADHGHQVAVSLGFDLEHAEPVVLVEERDALDQPRKALRQCCGCILHQALILDFIVNNGKPHSEGIARYGLVQRLCVQHC